MKFSEVKTLEHLLKYTQTEINQMYNMEELSNNKINEYKNMVRL